MASPLILLALLAFQDETVSAGAAAPPPTADQIAQAQREYTPEGAPADDYAFTGWCKGVLSGHMALAERVQSVLALDEVQQKIGAAYLKGYDEALEVGARSRSQAERDAAVRAEIAARQNWDPAMKADIQLAADTYLAWQLPGRCEHAAKRVAGRDDLFRMAPELEGEAISANSAAPRPFVPSTPAAPVQPAAAAEAPATSLFEPITLSTGLDQPAAAPADAEAAMATSEAPAPALDPGVADLAPVEVAVAEEPAPAAVVAPTPETIQEPAPAETSETEERASGKIVSMPRKGRLFPWGRRN